MVIHYSRYAFNNISKLQADKARTDDTGNTIYHVNLRIYCVAHELNTSTKSSISFLDIQFIPTAIYEKSCC